MAPVAGFVEHPERKSAAKATVTMNKYLIILILTFVGFVTIICSALPARAQDRLPQGDFSALKKTDEAVVAQVIDPQTLSLSDGRVLRLSGLDLSDYNPSEPGNFSLAALVILRDMLEGKNITIYQTPDNDKGRINRMGHMLAHVERSSDRAWVQGSLLALGLARVRSTSSNHEMTAQMYALETVARAEKIGLWGNPRFTVLTPETAQNGIGGFGIVEGTVYSAALKNNRIYINFGPDWREDFTLSLTSEAKRELSKQNLDPLNWAGKRVRGRGWLEEYNGPSIEIDHASAIELLN